MCFLIIKINKLLTLQTSYCFQHIFLPVDGKIGADFSFCKRTLEIIERTMELHIQIILLLKQMHYILRGKLGNGYLNVSNLRPRRNAY